MTTIKCRMTECKNNLDGFCGKQFLVIMKYKTCGGYIGKQKERSWKDTIADFLFKEDINPQTK